MIVNAPTRRHMTNLLYTGWELWYGQEFPTEKTESSVYYYPNNIDIENESYRDELIVEIHRDGLAPTKSDAANLLDNAIVVHGEVLETDDDLYYYTGTQNSWGEAEKGTTHSATWVEIDEYVE